jgi:hypothetical protein
MKLLRLLSMAALVAFGGLAVSGCYTGNQAKDTSPRFHDEKSVNVVMRFYKWDNFFIVQPAYRDDGFLHQVQPAELDQAFNKLQISRGTAVVLMGWNYDSIETAQNVDHWKSVLSGLGFQRVVCLRDYDDTRLNGLPIINDWRQTPPQPKQTAGL